MFKIVLASHGRLADGMKSAVEKIMGNERDIKVINAYTDNIDLEDEVKKLFDNLKNTDKLIVVTDLLGGSVNNTFVEYLPKFDFHLITGMNLLLILELLLLKDENNIEEEINRILNNAKKGIFLCNNLLKETGEAGEF